jgi:hypothetical protein
MIESRILGRIALDPHAVASDVATVLASPPAPQHYSEYRFGTFSTYVLRSPPEGAAGLFRGTQRASEKSALCGAAAYLDALIERYFETDRLQMARVYVLQDALLIPHRDYVEFEEDARRMVRVHVPLSTNARALHSENDTVFHMRTGEVWFLDVTQIHAACNEAATPRLSLVLDFVLDGLPIDAILRPTDAARSASEPDILARPPLEDGFADSVRALGAFVRTTSFRDVAQLLARVHFHRQASAASFFDWMRAACVASGDAALVDKADRLCTFLTARRAVGERFTL